MIKIEIPDKSDAIPAAINDIFEYFNVNIDDRIKILGTLLNRAKEDKARMPVPVDPRQMKLFKDKKK